jgi:hypothetical protein
MKLYGKLSDTTIAVSWQKLRQEFFVETLTISLEFVTEVRVL